MRTLFTVLALAASLAACGDDDNKAVDAGTKPPIDAAIDAPPAATLDCPTYCSTIKANCTGLNAQYTADTNCMATCAKLPLGALADTSGNTVGCRLYHAQNAVKTGQTPEVHCPHAGPGGAATNAAAGVCGDACTSFCDANIAVCGLKDGVNANGQYASKDACLLACKGDGAANLGFDKTHLYKIDGTMTPAVAPKGDSLACRIYHLTNAAIDAASATQHCPHTQATPTGPCSGAATP